MASEFADLLRIAALDANVGYRALGVRTLLHLPRVATARGEVTRRQILCEVRRNARLLRRDNAKGEQLLPDGKFSLDELIFADDVDPVAAGELFASLHYLRSQRPGSVNFALLDPVQKRPVTICSLAPLDWRKVGSRIWALCGISPEGIWDVSRVFSCDEAPPNAISFLLARVRSSLRRSAANIDLLVTTVDPNLGFGGSSYRAANWQQWLTVQPRPYMYLDHQYVSPRQLRLRFGTSNPAELEARFPGHRFQQSRARLLSSLIFCCRVTRETEVAPAGSLRPMHR